MNPFLPPTAADWMQFHMQFHPLTQQDVVRVPNVFKHPCQLYVLPKYKSQWTDRSVDKPYYHFGTDVRTWKSGTIKAEPMWTTYTEPTKPTPQKPVRPMGACDSDMVFSSHVNGRPEPFFWNNHDNPDYE